MTKIRTVVVDDEPVARERIIGLLNQEKDIEVVGEYSDGTQAVSAIQQQHPDLVFLDVQMPACDGFGVIQQLQPEQVPAVVFVTAYDEYALRAFEVHAIDYLLKPFGKDRFAQTLQHAREHLERRRAGDLGKRLMALVQDIKPEPQKLDRLVVKSGGRVFFLRTQEIDWIEANTTFFTELIGVDSPRTSNLTGIGIVHSGSSPTTVSSACRNSRISAGLITRGGRRRRTFSPALMGFSTIGVATGDRCAPLPDCSVVSKPCIAPPIVGRARMIKRCCPCRLVTR